MHGFPTPDGPPTYRNRYVKTQLGRLIDGHFLFTGSDTVVRKPLTQLLDLHCDIAAAPNHSRDTLAEQIWSEDQANLDAMGWQVREPYVNGGVIWYGGTPGSKRLADVWHCLWQKNVEKTERQRDQPALNHALHSENSIAFKKLNHEFNAQYLCNIDVAINARIWHAHYSSDTPGRDEEVMVIGVAKAKDLDDSPSLEVLALEVLQNKTPYKPKRSLVMVFSSKIRKSVLKRMF